MKLSRWARATLLVSFILLSIGVLPLWVVTTFLPGVEPTLFALAFFLLAPLGAVIFCAGCVLYLVALLRR